MRLRRKEPPHSPCFTRWFPGADIVETASPIEHAKAFCLARRSRLPPAVERYQSLTSATWRATLNGLISRIADKAGSCRRCSRSPKERRNCGAETSGS